MFSRQLSFVFAAACDLAAGFHRRLVTNKWYQSQLSRDLAVAMASPPRTRGRSPAGKVDGSKKNNGSSGSGAKTPPRTPSPSRSPPSRSRTRDTRRSRTRDARRLREVVVERIIREGSSGNWPQLTKTNYHEWSLRMKLKLQARHLWDAVEYDDVEFDDDHSAL